MFDLMDMDGTQCVLVRCNIPRFYSTGEPKQGDYVIVAGITEVDLGTPLTKYLRCWDVWKFALVISAHDSFSPNKKLRYWSKEHWAEVFSQIQSSTPNSLFQSFGSLKDGKVASKYYYLPLVYLKNLPANPVCVVPQFAVKCEIEGDTYRNPDNGDLIPIGPEQRKLCEYSIRCELYGHDHTDKCTVEIPNSIATKLFQQPAGETAKLDFGTLTNMLQSLQRRRVDCILRWTLNGTYGAFTLI